MTGEFDPIKAVRGELEGLGEVARALTVWVREAERVLGESEARLNALRKIKGYLDMETERKRSVLRQLEEQQERGV